MNDIKKMSQVVIFQGSARLLRKNGRSDHKKSDYWRQEAPRRKRVWKRCLITSIVTALITFLLAHGEKFEQRVYVTLLLTFVVAMGCACVLIIMYKNEINACKSAVAEWDSVRVGIGPRSMTVEHTSRRDSVGQYLGDIEPVLRGYKPIYQSNVPYDGIKQIILCRPRNLLIIQGSGSDTVLRKGGYVVKTKSFYEGNNFSARWVYIPLVFKDNCDFLRVLKEKTTVPVTEVESLEKPFSSQE